MKWTNRGHELDKLGADYVKIKNLYIWGAGKNGRDCLGFLQWLNVADDFNIAFIDRDTKKMEAGFCGKEVKPVDTLTDESFDADHSIVVRAFYGTDENFDRLDKAGAYCFHWQAKHNSRKNFIQNFVAVYYMYRYGKLLSHWMNVVTTLRCNLNCKGCLNFNDYISDPKDMTLEDFKEHIDIVFAKFDMHYSIHFSGGEPFLNKELPGILRYLSGRYGERYYDAFVITNGTVLPSEELLTELKSGGFRVFIDDYRSTVPLAVKIIPKLEEKLQEYGIEFTIGKADFWYDVLTEPSVFNTEEELITHRDNCNLFLQGFGCGRIYSCGYTQFSVSAGLISENVNDYLNIENASKMELLEFRQGYTSTGYVDFCRKCNGIGTDSVKIEAAVQISKRRQE